MWRSLVILILAQDCGAQHANVAEFELTPQDGWGNNLLHPEWGAIDGQLLRKSPVAYSDSTFQPSGGHRPNPFAISQRGHHGPPGLGSMRNRTAFMVFFGQQVVEEILDSQRPGCPREFFNIPVKSEFSPSYDPGDKGVVEMPFLRTRYDQRTGYSPNMPRQQLNEITPFIDGTLMYGPGKAWTDTLRELSEEHRGRLKTADPGAPISESFPAQNDIRLPFANPPPPREHELKPVKRFWRIGNPRGNENPFLLAFGVLFFRYHNYLADQYAAEYPDLNDEQVFNLARKKVIAVHQKIVLYDWLPAWLQITEDGDTFPVPSYNNSDPNDPFNGYNPNVHPGISQEFQTAAMRFGHTLVTPGIWVRDKSVTNCSSPNAFKNVGVNIPNQPDNVHSLRLCNAYWNSQEFLASSGDAFENILLGLASTLSEREDNIVVPDLREHLFGPLEFSRRDLVALNIQRARDHGLPGYNAVREAYRLPRVTSWEDINTADVDTNTYPEYPGGCFMCEPLKRLKMLYGNTTAPDDLDLFSGGLLETTPDGPGELFRAIMLEQFLRIRHGDRFWFENRDNGLFTEADIQDIFDTNISTVIEAVTGLSAAEIGDNPFLFSSASGLCEQPRQLAADTDDTLNSIPVMENCTRLELYDYFSGSEYSFAMSFGALGLLIPVTIGVMILMSRIKQRKMTEARRRDAPRKKDDDPNTYLAVEWMGPKESERNIKIKFDMGRKKLHVTDMGKKPLRMIDLRFVNKVHLRVASDKGLKLISVRVPGEIDLVLMFVDMSYRGEFQSALETFLRSVNVARDLHENMPETMILKDATTKEMRQDLLDKFFRVVCLQAFKQNVDGSGMRGMDAKTANSISSIQLTRTEFADALGLKPTSMFVRNMFLMSDKNRNGFVSFHEFMEMFMILARGGADEKAQMMFNMFDLKGKGVLTPKEFTKMIKSMLDLSDTVLSASELSDLVGILYQHAGIRSGDKITLSGFKKIFASDEYEKTLETATLALQGQNANRPVINASLRSRRKTFFESFSLDYENDSGSVQREKTKVKVRATQTEPPKSGLCKKWNSFIKYVENYRRHIFWVTLYSFITIGIFVERAYYYSVEREHAGLRRLAGYGVSVTRGAASGMMWTYSCLLLTMSRNMITFLRETFLHRFIPFDSAHAFHKFVAILGLFFTVMHVVGHAINLYHISTWASGDLNCMFREFFRATHVLATFHYWAWTTITGLTGISLTVIVIIMYVFAMPYARRNLFGAFWFTHSLYILLYILMIMHGTGRLVQSPLTQNFLLGPLLVFVIDKLISYSRRQVEISVMKADLLPSDVLGLTFKRPLSFEYRSGQWVRIACKELGASEYHPFTLTSAPHEDHLSLHIRAVGPWTMNVRKTYDSNNRDGKPFPKVCIDGPFGEGHQDWYRYNVAVLVGGGIGVTPFASILKDIVFRSKTESARFPCQKVYFLWVTRTQKQFEWLTDIIKEVEENDKQGLVKVHIFITQFQQKFDLRTTMLYICERHFQRICGKSLFTGLRATTHFGRPQFEEFLKSLHFEHPKVTQVGVFSCGPPPMTLNVDRACKAMNNYENYPTYAHHFENF